MSKFFSIHKAADFLGVSTQTLRRWEKNDKLVPSHRTPGGQRRYDVAKLQPHVHHAKPSTRPTIAYARVSSHDQKDDLDRQVRMLEMYCSAQGWGFSIIKDLGSGMNYYKRGLIPIAGNTFIFNCVGLAASFWSSLAPCHRQWSLAPDLKICAASLLNL